MFSFKELIILQSLPVWKQLVSVGVDCSLTFDLEVGQRVEQRVLGHQLLVDGVLETHGAGVGARHRQIRLHGWINEQGVRWKTHKAAWARGRQQSDTFQTHLSFCSLLMKLTPLTRTTETLRVGGENEVVQLPRDWFLSEKRPMANSKGRGGECVLHLTSVWFQEISEINLKDCHYLDLWHFHFSSNNIWCWSKYCFVLSRNGCTNFQKPAHESRLSEEGDIITVLLFIRELCKINLFIVKRSWLTNVWLTKL